MQKISLIIPAYNAEKYLEFCLDSISKQTFSDFEAFILDDGSRDLTRDIALACVERDSRFKYIELKGNSGVNFVRKIGVSMSDGEYIGFIDSDDWIEPNMVASMVDRLETDGSDIAICGISHVSDEEGPKLKKDFRFKRKFCIDSPLFEFSQMRIGTGSLCNKVYRRHIVADNYIWELPARVDFGEDYIVNIGAFYKAKKISLVPGVYYKYRQHSDSLTKVTDNARAFINLLNAYSICLQHYSDYGDLVLDSIDMIYQKQIMFNCYRVFDRSEFKGFSQQLFEILSVISKTRPESIYSLVHSFDIEFELENNFSNSLLEMKKFLQKLFYRFIISSSPYVAR